MQSLSAAAPMVNGSASGVLAAPPSSEAAPAAPPAPAPAPVRRAENELFSRLVGHVSTRIGVLLIRDHLRKRELEPEEPSEDDVERATDATADAIARALGDAEVPWWGGLACAWGNLYLTMRMGARKLETETPPAPAPAIVLGAGVPVERKPPPPPRGSTLEPLPPVNGP